MTRQEAMQKMRRLLGKDVRYRVAKTLTGPEKRAKARAEFEALDLQLRELHRKEGELLLAARAYRFEIYRCEGWMNLLVGKGDTWEQAFASIKPDAFMPRRAQAGGEAAAGSAS